jgi:hypothetical protein
LASSSSTSAPSSAVNIARRSDTARSHGRHLRDGTGTRQTAAAFALRRPDVPPGSRFVPSQGW